MKGAPKTPVRFEAIWAEIDHPTQGKILYDTGYTWRFLDATQRFPQRIYAKLTQVSILPYPPVFYKHFLILFLMSLKFPDIS